MLIRMETPKVLTSIYGRALQILALVKDYSSDAMLVFDPSLDPQPDVPGSFFDPEVGFTLKPVPSNTSPNERGAYMIYGHVLQPNLAIPDAVWRPNGTPYTLDGRITCVFTENVGQLEATRVSLETHKAAGHPLFNNGISVGPYLVARGDKTFEDDNKVVVLLWASKPYNERQVQA